MEKSNNVKRKTLTSGDLQNYPVWTWDEGMEYREPVLEKEPSVYDYNTLFIKAYFKTSGYEFDGYIMACQESPSFC